MAAQLPKLRAIADTTTIDNQRSRFDRCDPTSRGTMFIQ
ncbi:hypothetical protein AVDCRST_MAG94-1361 [uncultured Leptolyngbya sp.]|uniref:Uncharacterized protein n=1 Tax=uncultured Leptolyngbya sp. TaxID=332963 RepID=A0A6J4KYM9_9CYAN|nr:hypothetical protein AVDCRST_MAG94-1361 [uncultured Leptolyngbya sp.]